MAAFTSNKGSKKLIGGILMSIFMLIFLSPLFLIIMNSFKTQSEYVVSIISLPKSFNLDNYKYILKEINYPKIYFNSIVIEIISVTGIIIVSSMAASKVARYTGKFNTFVYYLLLLSMIIPFQARILPLMSVVGKFKMSNSLIGMCVLHIATLSPPVFFMYAGAMKTVSVELEEAAKIDGANYLQTFFKIIFPLLSPMTMTVGILYGLVVWNSFLIPMLVLNRPSVRTVPLAIFKFYAAYEVNWVAMFAAIVVGTLPLYTVFLFMQKYVVSGVMNGGVKG